MRKAKTTILFAFIVFAGVYLGFKFYQKQITEHFVQDAQEKKVLLSASNSIWELWREGKSSSLYIDESNSCPGSEYLNDKCSQDLMECVLKSYPFKVMKKGAGKIIVKKIENIDRYTSGENVPREGTRVLLGYGASKLTLFLENSCSKLYLPQRIYGFGPESNPDESHRFDNFQRHIFIDKKMNKGQGMTLKEMGDFCHKRGMQLLESHILDAAAFHPVDLKNNRPLNFLRPRLPWTRRFKTEFVAKAQKNKNFKFEEKFCSFLFSKECITKENISLPSWLGLRNPLGGLIEVVRNIEDPKSPLVPSSIYFPIHSKWHLLGLRSRWNGETFDERDFDIKVDLDDLSKLETGFRCMQEEWMP